MAEVRITAGGRRILVPEPPAGDTVWPGTATHPTEATLYELDGSATMPAALARMMSVGRSIGVYAVPVAQYPAGDGLLGPTNDSLRWAAALQAQRHVGDEGLSETQMRGDDQQLASAAAHWWADRLSEGAPAKRTGVVEVDAAAALLAHVPPPTPQQVRKFRDSLEKTIADQLESSGTSYVRMDYDPDHALAGALQSAGISAKDAVTYLPWKTNTFIHQGELTTTGQGDEK